MTGSKLASADVSDDQLRELTGLAETLWGLQLGPKKKAVVQGRLQKLLRATECKDLDELLGLLRSGRDANRTLQAFDVLSTNHTHFFREAAHLELFKREVVEPLAKSPVRAPRLRVWSAGCSNGCEPYSIAIILAQALANRSLEDVKILATDLAISELRAGRRGQYNQRHVESIPAALMRKHFQVSGTGAEASFQISADLRAMVRFALLNLLEPWTLRGPFDAIFCRNVLIYFDEPTRMRIIARFVQLLSPGGLLFLGTSEGIAGKFPGLTSLMPSAYRRTA